MDREIWLWDFGGQADQRLVHLLYMDRTALILLLFNADQEDVLPGLRYWQTALRRCVKEETPHFLVAGRIDTGFKASRGKLQAFAKEQGLAYHETSAKSGDGCDELRAAMIAGIPWAQMEKRTSPRIFKLIKDEILKLRDEGQVLHTFKALRELLWRRLPGEPRFTDETLQTVTGLLDGPGVVKELDYGTCILLAPEWINACAQAVNRILCRPFGACVSRPLNPGRWPGLACSWAFGPLRWTPGSSHGPQAHARERQRWVQQWIQQPHPVMLVIGTFSEDDERAIGKDKLEFAEVRWMETSSVLQREGANGTKPVKQIEFKGERLDLTSVRRWRERVLRGM